MIAIRKSAERGRSRQDWLDSRHSFSFADYRDSRFMGFRALRVINEDWIAGGGGFGWHGHRDMEILTWIVAGKLEHKDSMGTGSVIAPSEAQIMSAGTGIMHSEFNASAEQPVHLLQIWMLPEAQNLTPRYEQRRFAPEERRNRLRLIGARDGREGAVTIFQDIDLFAASLDDEAAVSHALRPGRAAWLQLVAGAIELGGQRLEAGDGAAVEHESVVAIRAKSPGSDLLLFDLA